MTFEPEILYSACELMISLRIMFLLVSPAALSLMFVYTKKVTKKREKPFILSKGHPA